LISGELLAGQPGQATTDQWFQWSAFSSKGTFAVDYYDRQYGSDETTGFSDFSLSGSSNLTKFGTARVSSGSMPPPTQSAGRRAASSGATTPA
jgi:hypothetical protein